MVEVVWYVVMDWNEWATDICARRDVSKSPSRPWRLILIILNVAVEDQFGTLLSLETGALAFLSLPFGDIALLDC